MNNAPNPNKINVSSVTETVYGESLDLQKLYMEIYRKLVDLVKTMLTNLVADEKGMKEMLGSVYDLVFPVLIYNDYDLFEQ